MVGEVSKAATLERPVETTEDAQKTVKVPLIDRAAASVAKVAARDDYRPVLSGICIRDGQAMAADGFAMMVCDVVHEERTGPAIDPGEIVIPARALAAFSKRAKGLLAFVATGNATVGVGYVGAYGTEQAELLPIDGRFPDVNTVFPSDEPTLTIALDARYLHAMLGAILDAKKATDSATDMVFLHTYGAPHRPIVVSSRLGEFGTDRRIDAMLMPMVSGSPGLPSGMPARKGAGNYNKHPQNITNGTGEES